MMKPPGWFKGTQGEWDNVPELEQDELKALPADLREKRLVEIMGVVRANTHEYDSQAQKAKVQQGTKKAKDLLYGRGTIGALLRNVGDSLEGIKRERIQDILVFLLDVKRDPWYISNCNNRAFLEKFIHKMDAQTPPNYHWEPDMLVDWRYRHIEGQSMLQPYIARDPQTPEERQRIRDEFGIGDPTVAFLAKKDCTLCNGKGYVYVSDYPEDPVANKLTHSEVCKCVGE